jgi:hypothetical protein
MTAGGFTVNEKWIPVIVFLWLVTFCGVLTLVSGHWEPLLGGGLGALAAAGGWELLLFLEDDLE